VTTRAPVQCGFDFAETAGKFGVYAFELHQLNRKYAGQACFSPYKDATLTFDIAGMPPEMVSKCALKVNV
jgi:hypothetical protein